MSQQVLADRLGRAVVGIGVSDDVRRVAAPAATVDSLVQVA